MAKTKKQSKLAWIAVCMAAIGLILYIISGVIFPSKSILGWQMILASAVALLLLAVVADANHTGCIYLGAYDSKSDALVAVYGGPEDAGFKWELTGKGDIVLSDPATGESTVLTRADGGSSYGNDMTNVNGTNMTYTNGSVTVTNGNYSGTLTKADTGKEGEINEQFSALFSAIATNLSSEDNIRIKDTPGNTWGR